MLLAVNAEASRSLPPGASSRRSALADSLGRLNGPVTDLMFSKHSPGAPALAIGRALRFSFPDFVDWQSSRANRPEIRDVLSAAERGGVRLGSASTLTILKAYFFGSSPCRSERPA